MIDMGKIFVFSLLLGAVFGAFYDVVRILRLMRAKPNMRIWNIVGAVGDTLFIIFFSLCFSVFVYYTNDGIFRAFMIIGVFCGFFGYYFTVGRLVIRTSEKIIRIIRRFSSFVFRTLMKPVRKIFLFIWVKIIYPIIFALRMLGYSLYGFFYAKTSVCRERKYLSAAFHLIYPQYSKNT